jgi:hypothetical protein
MGSRPAAPSKGPLGRVPRNSPSPRTTARTGDPHLTVQVFLNHHQVDGGDDRDGGGDGRLPHPDLLTAAHRLHDEEDRRQEARTLWRVAVGRFALHEKDPGVQVEQTADQIWVHAGDAEATLSYPEFVEATVGRLPEGHGLGPRLVKALRCLA